jgi:DNA replication protein DnaC
MKTMREVAGGDSEIQSVLEQAINRMTPEEWEAHDQRIRDERERELQAQAGAKAQARRQDLAQWGVPRKDIERVIAGDLDETEPLQIAKRFASGLRALAGSAGSDTPCTVLVLSGPPGCGKTTAAASLLAWRDAPWASRCAHHPIFIPVSRLIRWNRFEEKAMVALEKAAALVIDDLGSEYMDDKGAFLSFFDGLLNARYADWLPTVITTNLSASQFRGRYGTRAIDRLREVGRFIEIRGESMRGRTQPQGAEHDGEKSQRTTTNKEILR